MRRVIKISVNIYWAICHGHFCSSPVNFNIPNRGWKAPFGRYLPNALNHLPTLSPLPHWHNVLFMITVLIQHRLRCKVAQSSFSTIYSTIFAFGGVPAPQHSSSLLLSLNPQKMTSSEQWESKDGLAHILLHAVFPFCSEFLFMCGLSLALSIAVADMASPLLSSPSLGWKTL